MCASDFDILWPLLVFKLQINYLTNFSLKSRSAKHTFIFDGNRYNSPELDGQPLSTAVQNICETS